MQAPQVEPEVVSVIRDFYGRLFQRSYNPKALVDNTLLDLQNSSHPTQPHSIIAKYLTSRMLTHDIESKESSAGISSCHEIKVHA